MSYNRTTDFLGLLRNTGNGARLEAMPGLDWLMTGLAAAGMFTLWVHPTTAPQSNQATTVWLKTNSASFAAEGSVWLWHASAAAFQPATPQLWQSLFAAIGVAP